MGDAAWVIVGADGQLGRELTRELDGQGNRDVLTLGRGDLDIRDPFAVREALADVRTAVVVNAAAWNAVDLAEDQEVAAHAVNAIGPANLADACGRFGHWLVHVSTDYVFGAPSAARLPRGEGDPVSPRCAYARTKAIGEKHVRDLMPDRGLIVRTAWLYSEFRSNFALTMLARAREGLPVRVVTDQWGQPTWARDLARQIVALGDRAREGVAPAGIYHGTNAGVASWWEFARWIYSLAGADPGLVAPMDTADLERPAERPAWSVLGHDRWAEAGLPPMRPWREALVAALPALREASMTVA